MSAGFQDIQARITLACQRAECSRALRALSRRHDPRVRYGCLRAAFSIERMTDEDAAQLLLLVAETERALTNIPYYWDGPSHLAKQVTVCVVLDEITATEEPFERGLLVLRLRRTVADMVGQRSLDVLAELAKSYLTLAGFTRREIRRAARMNGDLA